MAMSPAPPPPDDVEVSPLPPPPPSPLLIVTHSPLPPPPPSSPPVPPPPPSPFSPRSRSSPPPPGSISIDRQSPPPPPFPPMPPLPTFDGEDTTPEPGKGPLHRRTLSERDGDSSSFSSPLPPCPEDPPAPQSASCTPPKYQPQDENEEDTAKSEEDASSAQEVRSVEADEDDLSADADTEDMSIDIREERESALPTPPPPPSPPAATPMGGGTPPPPPPPPYSPPGRKSIPAAGNDASLKSTVADAQSRTGTVPSTMSSIASMRTAASNREIMATDVVRDPSPERPRWYIGEIENYTIIDKVGSGTYGEVFKCQHKITKDIVALKKMRSDVEKNGFPVTSIREMKILKQLKHPNVVTLKEIVSSNAPTKDGKRPPLYFAFEYLEHDLSGLLNHPRVKFSRTQIQCYMRQLLCGVAFMHRNKIVHRDIKASNLLLNNQGVLKVADFGLSRSWTEVNAKAGRYTNKVVTLWYRSPELLLGSTSYDFSVDVWSIGCIFGELLLGRPILQGKTEIDQLQMIFGLVGRPTEENWPDFMKLPGAKDVMFDDKYVCPLRERFKSFPPHAIDLLEKLLTLDPAKRITAAEAMDHDYFWRVITCKPRDLPKFAVASTHEYQSKKRHHEEMAAQAAAAGDRHVRARGHRGEHYSHSRSHQGDKATGHPHGNHHSNRTERGRPYRHREGEYFDRDRERDRSREPERGRSRDRDRPERPRDRSRERDDRHGHRPRHEEGNHHRRRGQDGASSLPA